MNAGSRNVGLWSPATSVRYEIEMVVLFSCKMARYTVPNPVGAFAMGHAQNFTVRLDLNVLPIARDRVEARLHF